VVDRNTLVVVAALLFAAIGIPMCRQSSTASSTGFPCRSGTPTHALPHIGLRVLGPGCS